MTKKNLRRDKRTIISQMNRRFNLTIKENKAINKISNLLDEDIKKLIGNNRTDWPKETGEVEKSDSQFKLVSKANGGSLLIFDFTLKSVEIKL